MYNKAVASNGKDDFAVKGLAEEYVYTEEIIQEC